MIGVHQDPVWRERSNFVVRIGTEADGSEITSEQLFCRRIDDRRFEVCCIPFFAYDLALGDIVETDSTYEVQRVSRRSGRYAYRIYFGESNSPRTEVLTELKSRDFLTEWYSPLLLAVDAADLNRAELLVDYLQEQEDKERLIFEASETTNRG